MSRARVLGVAREALVVGDDFQLCNAFCDSEIEKIDAETSFLNGILQPEIRDNEVSLPKET